MSITGERNKFGFWRTLPGASNDPESEIAKSIVQIAACDMAPEMSITSDGRETFRPVCRVTRSVAEIVSHNDAQIRAARIEEVIGSVGGHRELQWRSYHGGHENNVAVDVLVTCTRPAHLGHNFP